MKTDFYTLSIIIVNYNGERYLKDCFDSIYHKCQNFKYEVIFVDNNSSDGSVELTKKKFPWVTVIESDENLGFSKGNNLGVNNSSGDYILLLNNDTVLLDNMSGIFDFFDSPSVGAVGIKMLGAEGEHRKSVGYFPSPFRLFKLSWMHVPLIKLVNKTISNKLKVDWIEGSFLMTTRKIWDDVNGLDETYFMYAEDVDFCKKLSLLNKSVFYSSDYRYIHYGGYNSSREHLLKTGLSIYIKKFHSGLYLKLCQISILINFNIKTLKKKLSI